MKTLKHKISNETCVYFCPFLKYFEHYLFFSQTILEQLSFMKKLSGTALTLKKIFHCLLKLKKTLGLHNNRD